MSEPVIVNALGKTLRKKQRLIGKKIEHLCSTGDINVAETQHVTVLSAPFTMSQYTCIYWCLSKSLEEGVIFGV